MIDKLNDIEKRYEELGEQLADPNIVSDPRKLRDISKERSDLEEVVNVYREYKDVLRTLEEDRRLLEETDDPELRDMAEAEIEELEEKQEQLEERLKLLLIPKDPNDSRNAILEIRAGTGGDEAGLFAGDLFRMYSRYAERKGWKVEVLSSNPQGIGGFKEIIAMISGDGAYGRLKYEAGVHRVQRIPVTEQSGRIHTSAASVAVLPEAEEVDIDIAPNELRIDVFRSSGPGGQSVNTTDSAVRITHIPTGLVVTCQDEKSQHKNKAKALKVLRSRLLEMKQEEERKKLTDARRKMVSTGDRSAKIRTYNFPQGRVTDHRIGLTVYQLEDVLDGDLDFIIDKLATEEKEAYLKAEAGEAVS
ncbi:MAG: peptide chain release factor 1 [candidate division KSB1 bacterium]|nr:peptide chain release factor 1 [candidate division KSB1 bacterium]MDQ7066276.1 peptide chain release factor 1 [candidate division KSB1 bacterium]